MKALTVAVGLFLLTALPVLAGPKAPDQHNTQFHALSALSQSALPQSLRDKELGTIDKGNSNLPVKLTDAELNAITGGDPFNYNNQGGRGGAIGYGNSNGCNCGQGPRYERFDKAHFP